MSETEQEVHVEIQKELASINDNTIKIKQELLMIIDLIKEDGRLGIAAKDANEVLSNVAQDLGIDITPDLAETEESRMRMLDNPLINLTSASITKKILSIMEDTQQSQ